MARFNEKEVFEKMSATKLLPLFNYADLQVCKAVIRACYNAGIRAFELTDRDENAFQVFQQLVPFAADELPELSLGAGTILTENTAQKYIDAGADFIIAPNMDTAVGNVCIKNGVPWIPGCLTPTEFQQAYNAGAKVIKLFPAGTVGPDYVKHIRGPLPHLKIVVTGGVQVNAAAVKTWLNAGVFAAGVGSQLFSKEVIQSGNYDSVTTTLKEILEGLA
jgi:2-dehydro-3-deoxyphosphogluconate aldolase/(4S)-4-hydroxy-2-oxoglutarate aldolase